MSDWHPVTTPPENDGPYLVLMPKRTLDRYSVQHWDRREGSFTNDFGITYWMELPGPVDGEALRA